jgi:acyl-CoA synthetase (AMP-forming)/AMP-acid ligase II
VLKSDERAEIRRLQLKSEIMALCRRDLSAHQVPAVTRFVPVLETSPSGKLARCATWS